MHFQTPAEPNTLRETDFHFLANTFRFGADPDLSVITAYLAVNANLRTAVRQRRPSNLTAEPDALIVAYDVEDAFLTLLCVDKTHTQYSIDLNKNERAALYAALRNFTQKQYLRTPEQILNLSREAAYLPPLK